MTSAVIRTATEQDVPGIFSLICELADFEKLSHEVTSTTGDLHRALFGPAPAAEALVATVRDEMAAFALFFTTYSTFAGRPGLYLEDLYVRPAHRGGGLGTQLIRRGAEIAIGRGYARYEWVVLDWNTLAIAFYEKCGAEMHGAWRRMRVSGEALRRLATGP
jgi:GNAT superfamily N-acetyltransferase